MNTPIKTREQEWPEPTDSIGPGLQGLAQAKMPIAPPYSRTGEIAAALAKAQGEMTNPAFDTANPFFKSRYASLAAVRNAIVPALAKHGIAITQDLMTTGDGTVACTTTLLHGSGQSLVFGPLVMPASKSDAQGFGSAGTYARRYALMAICGVAGDDDDDGNAATGKPHNSDMHDPRGDAVATVSDDRARELALQMIAVLELDDLEEKVHALKAYDLHARINKNQAEYIAASAQMAADQRAAWKRLLGLAKKLADKPAAF